MLSLWLLLYATSYFNEFFIPDSFKWEENGTLKKDLTYLSIALVEAFILFLLAYRFNTWYLNSSINKNKSIATWTFVSCFIIAIAATCFEVFSS